MERHTHNGNIEILFVDTFPQFQRPLTAYGKLDIEHATERRANARETNGIASILQNKQQYYSTEDRMPHDMVHG